MEEASGRRHQGGRHQGEGTREEATWGRHLGEGIMEEASWRMHHGGTSWRHLGDIWEASTLGFPPQSKRVDTKIKLCRVHVSNYVLIPCSSFGKLFSHDLFSESRPF